MCFAWKTRCSRFFESKVDYSTEKQLENLEKKNSRNHEKDLEDFLVPEEDVVELKENICVILRFTFELGRNRMNT